MVLTLTLWALHSLRGAHEREPAEPERLPVSVLTGFLGSGKTTLLRHLLREPGMPIPPSSSTSSARSAWIICWSRLRDEDMVLLAERLPLLHHARRSGRDAAPGLYKRRAEGEIPAFRRVVIETTGLADPAPILQTLMQDPQLARFLSPRRGDRDGGCGQRHGPARQADGIGEAGGGRRSHRADENRSRRRYAAAGGRLRRLNPAAPILTADRGRSIRPACSMPGSTTRRRRAWMSSAGCRKRPMRISGTTMASP